MRADQAPNGFKEETMSRVEVSARMKVRAGELEGFKRQAAESIRLTKEKHSPILRYDWFLSEDQTQCEVREVHADSARMMAHRATIAEAVPILLSRYAEDHRAAVFGDPSPELVERVNASPMGRTVKWYAFFQGLEPGPSGGQTASPGLKATFELTAHGTVRPGQLEGFKAQAAEIMRITREKDTRTLRYDWFLSKDGTEFEVREAYRDEEGLIEHNVHVREARDKLFRDFATDHLMTAYSEVSPHLSDLFKLHAGGVRRFSFFQGLEPSPTVLTDNRDRALSTRA
jgi:quinol monooxygenase YgiN